MNTFLKSICLALPLAVWAQDPEVPETPAAPPPAVPVELAEPGDALPPRGERLRRPDRPPREETVNPQYRGAALSILLQEIGDRTGKVILRDPGVNEIQVNLVSDEPMPVSEFLKAAESLLAMNDIALVPFRDKFLKVVPAAGVERSGAPLVLDPEQEQTEEDQLVSQILSLSHLDYTEVQTLITERLSETAKVQALERNNSLLITDTRANISRIQKILKVLDQPVEVRESVKIYQLVYATAADVKARLEELIEQSRADGESGTATRTNRPVPVTPRGVIRPGGNPNADAGTESAGGGAGSSPGLIRGNVQIVADERTNILLIISRPENDAFFEEMIGALDKKVEPEITVRIFNLQFADAEEASETLNELIGAATESSSENPNVERDGSSGTRSGQTLRDFVNRQPSTPASSGGGTSSGSMGIESMAENTRILADVRTNSLILMGRNRDLDVLEGVIQQIDIMLAQVAVRAVVMEVILSDNISYGIEWLQRSLTANSVQTVNGVDILDPVYSFGGGTNLLDSDVIDAANVTRDLALSSGGLSYFTTFYDFNLDAVLQLAQSNSQAKVVATPVIVTTDNTEAAIRVGERRAIPTTSATTIGGSVQSSYDYENIGLELTVTPRINPQGMVIMEVTQTAENVGDTTVIDGNEVPVITSREMEASVSIRSGGTLALGGLVREDIRDRTTKVPLLGDIPILGALFRSTSKENVRTELIVLLSPQVLVTSEEAEALTRRLKDATQLKGEEWNDGWGLPYEKPEEE